MDTIFDLSLKQREEFEKIYSYFKQQNEFLFKNKWHSGGTVSLEDLNQESYMLLFKAFKNNVDAEFRIAYLTETNKNRINRLLCSSCKNEKHDADFNVIGDSIVDYSDYIESEDRKMIARQFLKGCSKQTRRMIKMKLEGYDNDYIASKLEISSVKITRLYRNVIKRFQHIHNS